MMDLKVIVLLGVICVLVTCFMGMAKRSYKHRQLHRNRHSRKARFVRIRRDRPALQIAEVQVYDMYNMNIAPFATVMQSSTKDSDTSAYGPNIAVNGNISGWAKGELATTSHTDKSPYFMVDLRRPTQLSRITVFLRDESNFPNPNSSCYSKKDIGACIEILDESEDVFWRKSIDNWECNYDFPLRDLY